MNIKKVEHYELALPLKSPFVTSYGTLSQSKAFDLYLLHDEEGHVGIGELSAFEQPDYVEETLSNARQIIQHQLLPLLFGQEIQHPQNIRSLFQPIQGNFMAKAALETACWDLYAKQQHRSLTHFFSTTRTEIPVGVSLGMTDSIPRLLAQVAAYEQAGYQRIKVKIQPGNDFEPLQAIRQAFPQLTVMADANSAYKKAQLADLLRLDQLGLAMLEQPLGQRDFVGHSWLQQQMTTPICLDENIRTLEDVQTAKALNSCRAINLKIPRVGGISEALAIADFCQKEQLLVWLGGMFESGVGRALNLQFASQEMFQFPGDISAADRYYTEDIVTEPAVIYNGKIKVPTGAGIGVMLSMEKVARHCQKYQKFFPQ